MADPTLKVGVGQPFLRCDHCRHTDTIALGVLGSICEECRIGAMRLTYSAYATLIASSAKGPPPDELARLRAREIL